MKQKIFAIYDSKMEAYLQPIFARNNGEALRMFAVAANEEGGQFNKHAADYTLMLVGEWEDTTGEIQNYTANVSLGNALEFKNDGPDNQHVMPGSEHVVREIKGNGAVQGGE